MINTDLDLKYENLTQEQTPEQKYWLVSMMTGEESFYQLSLKQKNEIISILIEANAHTLKTKK